MVKHYNPSIVQDAQRIFNTKTNNISDEVGDIIPVVPVLPVCRIVRSSASGTVYTTPSDKDFYLTGFSMSFSKDVAATGSVMTLSAIIDGVSQVLHRFAAITLTAERDSIAIDLSFPIKIDRGTNITIGLTGTFNSAPAAIRGYTQETTAT